MTTNPPYNLLPDTSTISPDGTLHIANHSIPTLAQQFGTPLYIFDRQTIVNACQRYLQAFAIHYRASSVRVLYASKAYLSPHIARLVSEQGLGLDVVSSGELLVAQRAEVPMEHIFFHGNNKSEEELRLALKLGVGRIVLDNWSELDRLHRLTHSAQHSGQKPAVLIRVAPAVETDTHRYLQTGHASSKFGFPLANGEAKSAILHILREDKLRLLGLHAHSGTMLQESRPYQEIVERLLELALEVHAVSQWWPEEISPGGGWAIETIDSATTPQVEILARALQLTMDRALATISSNLPNHPHLPLPTLIIEPGRSIIARAGIAIYRIGARKPTPGGITYLVVDGGMADNIRPALYGARYTAIPIEKANAPATENICIAGRYCESGDILIQNVMLPPMREGDLLALPTAGAYCLPMSSNYNLVPRPAVILIDRENVILMERRETNQDLLSRYVT
jgi:diaminopimelate decarboxylase